MFTGHDRIPTPNPQSSRPNTRIIHLRNISTSPVAKPHKNPEIGNIIILVPKNLDQLQEDHTK